MPAFDPFRTARLMLALRQAGVVEQRLLEAMERTPREIFVPRPFHDSAWDDVDLPIDCGQSLTNPVIVGMMLQALRVLPGMSVLEVGTGAGYGAGLLAALGARLVSVERYRTLLEGARTHLEAAGVEGVELLLGDGLEGAPDAAQLAPPYDRIILWGAVEALPSRLGGQLSPGGIIVAPFDRDGRQVMVALEQATEGGWRETVLGPSAFTPLEPGVALRL